MNKLFNAKYIIGLLAAAALIGVGGWWYLQQDRNYDLVQDEEAQNWPTYQGSKFTIHYHPEWQPWGALGQPSGVQFGYVQESAEGSQGARVVGMSVKEYQNRDALQRLAGVAGFEGQGEDISLIEWLKKAVPDEGGKGVLVKMQKEDKPVTIVYYEESNGSIFEFEESVSSVAANGNGKQYDYDKIFQQMLSTFQFVQ